MTTYQAVVLIIATNVVPIICGGIIVFLWLKYVKGWRKLEKAKE